MAKDVMNKVRVGRTDLMVTSIGFGTSGLGDIPDTYGYGVDADRAKATALAIFGGPVNLIDTSRLYGMGRSEERIGASAAACRRASSSRPNGRRRRGADVQFHLVRGQRRR